MVTFYPNHIKTLTDLPPVPVKGTVWRTESILSEISIRGCSTHVISPWPNMTRSNLLKVALTIPCKPLMFQRISPNGIALIRLKTSGTDEGLGIMAWHLSKQQYKRMQYLWSNATRIFMKWSYLSWWHTSLGTWCPSLQRAVPENFAENMEKWIKNKKRKCWHCGEILP